MDRQSREYPECRVSIACECGKTGRMGRKWGLELFPLSVKRSDCGSTSVFLASCPPLCAALGLFHLALRFADEIALSVIYAVAAKEFQGVAVGDEFGNGLFPQGVRYFHHGSYQSLIDGIGR